MIPLSLSSLGIVFEELALYENWTARFKVRDHKACLLTTYNNAVKTPLSATPIFIWKIFLNNNAQRYRLLFGGCVPSKNYWGPYNRAIRND